MIDERYFDSIPKFNDLKFQYVYDFRTKCWIVLQDRSDVIAHILDSNDLKYNLDSNNNPLDAEVQEDFNRFKERPEYRLIHFQIPSINDIDAMIDIYEDLFVGAASCRAYHHVVGCNPDDAFAQAFRSLRWLRTTDFYRAPASSMYHDAFPGGLVYHSLKVAKNCVDLMYSNKFMDNSKLGEAVLCALIHDWCKIDLYESYLRNVKNDQTGVWEKVPSYRYKGSAIINLGHGVSSMFLATKFFKLNLEEASAIRWHMGAYRTSDAEFNELQSCNEQFPLVHLLQFADQLALVKY